VEVQAEGKGGSFSNFKINRRNRGFAKFFSTHPPLEMRIARLNQSRL
jgi:Zn-dependent protease with chaperone function